MSIHPELTVPIGGFVFGFSELPVEKLDELQAFIRRTTPHPLEAVKKHLEGLDLDDRQFLLEQARVDAKNWPPQVGTAAGALALLSSEPGQIEALRVGLTVHQPGTSEAEARRVFKALRKQAAQDAAAAKAKGQKYSGEGTVQRIFACLFGLDDFEPEAGESLPKEQALPTTRSTGS